MFFIQIGGFTSDSNGNFNGTGLVEASGMNMIVVRINYRVGILGFIGRSVVNNDTKGAVPNNGLKDSKNTLWTYVVELAKSPQSLPLQDGSSNMPQRRVLYCQIQTSL